MRNERRYTQPSSRAGGARCSARSTAIAKAATESICTPLALTTARSEAFSMFEWVCPEDADLTHPRVLKTANPASFVTEQFLAEQIQSPGLHPLEVARFHANVWTATADSWLPVGAWQACAAKYRIEPGEPIWVGVDVGGSGPPARSCG